MSAGAAFGRAPGTPGPLSRRAASRAVAPLAEGRAQHREVDQLRWPRDQVAIGHRIDVERALRPVEPQKAPLFPDEPRRRARDVGKGVAQTVEPLAAPHPLPQQRRQPVTAFQAAFRRRKDGEQRQGPPPQPQRLGIRVREPREAGRADQVQAKWRRGAAGRRGGLDTSGCGMSVHHPRVPRPTKRWPITGCRPKSTACRDASGIAIQRAPTTAPS
jgi:hypothetical protein